MGNMVVVARIGVRRVATVDTRRARARGGRNDRVHAVDASERANARLRRGRAGRSVVGALAGAWANERRNGRNGRRQMRRNVM